MTVIDQTRAVEAAHRTMLMKRALSGVGLVAAFGVAAVSSVQFAMLVLVLIAAFVVSVERMVIVLLFLLVAVEDHAANPYAGLWTSPIQDVGDFYYFTMSATSSLVPLPVAPMLVVPLILLARTFTGRVGPRLAHDETLAPLPATFAAAVVLGIGAVFTLSFYGVLRGGDVQQVYYQIFGSLIALSLAGVVARVGTPELASLFWRLLLYIAIYRAIVAILMYINIGRHLEEPSLYLTTHGDSIVWTLAIIHVLSNVLERADRASRWIAVTLAPLFGLAIVVNNRRLAWVTVFVALTYLILSSRTGGRRRLRSLAGVLVPIAAVYVAVGWVSPPSPVFAPVQAMQSVVSGDDRSSQTRDIEDYNLVATARNGFPLPSGFGTPYIEFVVADDISAFFPQYRFLPHNSVLGMLNLMGPVGLGLVLAPLALGVQAAHRTRRACARPRERTQGAMVVTAWICFLAFAWGDLGLFTPLPTAMAGIAAGFGIALYRSTVQAPQVLGVPR